MEYEILELNEKTVVGIVKKTTNENMQAVSDIGALWQKFMGEGIYQSIENKRDEKTIGLYTDFEGDFTKPYCFMTCTQVTSTKNIHPNLCIKTIKAGKYARFSVEGHIQKAVGEAWQEIWKLNLDRSYGTDFEEYHNNSIDMNHQKVDIYISVK